MYEDVKIANELKKIDEGKDEGLMLTDIFNNDFHLACQCVLDKCL